MGLGTLLIRADASPEIGAGHMMRCLALAQAWQDEGGKVVLAVAKNIPAIESRLRAENCEIVSVPHMPGSASDAAFTRAHAEISRAQAIVIDSYDFRREYQEQLKSNSWRLLCVDDEGRCESYSADIVLNQNVNALGGWYEGRLQAAELLLGTRFCLLRREFAKWREWERDIPAIARKLLVTLGGSTPPKLSALVMQALAQIAMPELSVIFVVSGNMVSVDSLKALTNGLECRFSFRENVSDMAQFMAEADIALSASGSTCWELCLLGLPSVLIDVADNQTPVARELARRKCAVYGGRGEDVNPTELTKTIQTLLLSSKLRETISIRSRRLVDGFGAQRVVSALRRRSKMPEVVGKGACA